ncbi:unnamed protein product [Cunninghamella blakesleeana]
MDIRFTYSVPSELPYLPHSLYRTNHSTNNNSIQYPPPPLLRPSWSTNTTNNMISNRSLSNNNNFNMNTNRTPSLPYSAPKTRYKQVKKKSSFPSYTHGTVATTSTFTETPQPLYSTNMNYYSSFEAIPHHDQYSHTKIVNEPIIKQIPNYHNDEYYTPQKRNKSILKTPPPLSSSSSPSSSSSTFSSINHQYDYHYHNNNNSNNNSNNHSKVKGRKQLAINTQSSNKPRSSNFTSNNNSMLEVNKNTSSTDHIKVQRKPLPILQQNNINSSPYSNSVSNHNMNYISTSHSLQQQQQFNNNSNNIIQNPKPLNMKPQWKVSGQHDSLLLRSNLSTTPPSLYENSPTKTSTTYSSSFESPFYQVNNNINKNSNDHITSSNNNGSFHPFNSSRVDFVKSSTPISTLSSSTSSSSSAVPGNTSTNPKKKVTTTRHKKSSSLSSSSISSISTRSRFSYNNDHESQTSHSQSSSTIEKRSRRYSQGDCHLPSSMSIEVNHPSIPKRTSTPKLRRVHSAKPCIKMINGFQQTNNRESNVNINASSNIIDLPSTSSTNETINYDNSNLNDLYNKKNDDNNNDNKNLNSTSPLSLPSFWNPRTEKDILPVKRTLSKRIRGLLLPQRSKLDETCKDRHVVEYQWSVARPMTPTDEISFFNDAFLDDPENGIMDNPFYMISQSWNITDQTGLHFNDQDFTQMDIYATSVQQRGPSLTPKILTQKFLVRPYRRDLYRLRIIFIWILQNISIIDQRNSKEKNHLTNPNPILNDIIAVNSANTNNNSNNNNNNNNNNINNNNIINGNNNSNSNNFGNKRLSLRRLSHRRSTSSLQENADELELPNIDVMHGDGLLPEGGGDVESFDDWLLSESANQVLLNRTCTSSIGMANLFCEMAIAAGFHETKVVYGYLRAPKDSIKSASMNPSDNPSDDDSLALIQNHAWCCVKVEGEYRFIDCWLASSSQPQNYNKIETHWFLTEPKDMIFTHFPQDSEDQCLEPMIHLSTFFALPYVWSSFFLHHIKFIRYDPFAISMVDDQVCHLSFRVDANVLCYAFVEVLDSSENSSHQTMRALSQCLTMTLENGVPERVYKIKAVLPVGYSHGWLKIYTGFSKSSSSLPVTPTLASSTSARQDHSTMFTSSSSSSSPTLLSSLMDMPNLSLCFRLTHHQHHPDKMKSFEFVQLHPCKYEFYIQEPQCYDLYPLQTYNFLIRGGDTHHKLAIRSPSGKLYKLMSYPQEHSYDGSVTISEIGKWSLIYLLHHATGWSLIATWECKNQ